MRRAEELRTLFDLLQPIDDIRETDNHCNENRARKVPFRAPVNRRSREPAGVTHSGRVAPHTTSARSPGCWMVGFVIPMPEGSNPEGKGLDARPTAGSSPPPNLADTGWSGLRVWQREAGCPDIDA